MWNSIGIVASCVGVLIGIAGLAFGLYERSQRSKTENVVREILRRLAGEVRVLYSNANWADTHFRIIGYLFTEATPDLIKIRQRVHDGARDAAACARQLGLAHSQIRGIQKAVFNDTEEILPEIQADDVKAAQLHGMTGNNGTENKATTDSLVKS